MRLTTSLVLVTGALLTCYMSQVGGQSTPKVERPPLEMQVVSRLGFDETVEKIKEAAIAEKYGVQGVHPLSQVLTDKGFPRERLTIVEVCNPASATGALNNDIRSGLHMPCPLMVYEKEGVVHVMTFDTRTMATLYEGSTMTETGAAVYMALRKILDSVDKFKGTAD